MKEEHRKKIYSRYNEIMLSARTRFNREEAERWGRARKYHLRGWLPANQRASIVDLACGEGMLLYFFIQQGYENVQGVDISPDQVALARQVTPHVIQDNVLDFLERHESSFDLLIGYDIIEHFHKNEVLRFLELTYNALKPGGRLILQTVNSDSPWGLQHRYGDFTHELAFNSNSLSRLLKMTGFTAVESRECDPVPFNYSISSTVRHVLWKMIRLAHSTYNIIETGHKGSGIFTRIFLISGVK